MRQGARTRQTGTRPSVVTPSSVSTWPYTPKIPPMAPTSLEPLRPAPKTPPLHGTPTRLFPGGEPAVDFYRAKADRQGGCDLELGCGTGHKLIPIASDGHPCTGLELSSDMLTEAQRKANERALAVEW